MPRTLVCFIPVQEYLGCLCERVTTYPRYYVQQDSVPLIDKNTSFVPLVHVKCLLKMVSPLPLGDVY